MVWEISEDDVSKIKTTATLKVTTHIDGPAISQSDFFSYKGWQVSALITRISQWLSEISIQCGIANIYYDGGKYGQWELDPSFAFPGDFIVGVDLVVEYFNSPVPVGDAGTDEIQNAVMLFEEKLADLSLHEGAYSLKVTKMENGTWPTPPEE